MALALLRTPIRVTEVSKEHHLLTKQNPSLPGSVVTSSTLVEGADCGYCDLLLVSLCLLVNMLLGLPYGNIEKNYEEERIIISTKDPDIQNLELPMQRITLLLLATPANPNLIIFCA